MFGDISYVSGVPKITPYEYRPLNKTKNWNPKNTQPKQVNVLGSYSNYYGSGNMDDRLNMYNQASNQNTYNKDAYQRDYVTNALSYADGGPISPDNQEGEQKAIDPQLLQAYRTIGAALGGGQDPNELVQQIVNEGLSMEDAKQVVQKVMDMINPVSPSQMPMAQMGMNAGMFAGQSMNSNIIKKPLMKDGGHTFVTSQPAYTKKSHTYFGTSNAPARDSYTDNDEITTSVKAVPREDATIEAEKGEYIYSKQGLYKIEGKKHSQGGTPLAAKGGEFIYSAHKDMAIDPKLQKEAGLKVSSSKALSDNTPAKILERNVDVKEYNRLKAILENPKSDAVTKKTAQFMLDKMDTKLQVIAKLQEAKKQPAPTEVENQYLEQSQTQQEINEQKQFAYGGDTLPEYQTEGEVTWKRDENGNPVKVTKSSVSGLDPNSKLVSPYTKGNEVAERKARLEEWYNAMKAEGYKGPNPLDTYDPSKPNQQYDDIGKLQEWTAKQYPEYVKTYLTMANPSTKVKDYLKSKGVDKLSDVKDFTADDAANLFKDQYFDWRLPIVFNKKEVKETPWTRPAEIPTETIETKKPHTSPVSRIDVPDYNAQIEALQRAQLATNLLSNQPFYVYTPENVLSLIHI
jgi:hypothetical protein